MKYIETLNKLSQSEDESLPLFTFFVIVILSIPFLIGISVIKVLHGEIFVKEEYFYLFAFVAFIFHNLLFLCFYSKTYEETDDEEIDDEISN